jgi:hypothetical protein
MQGLHEAAMAEKTEYISELEAMNETLLVEKTREGEKAGLLEKEHARVIVALKSEHALALAGKVAAQTSAATQQSRRMAAKNPARLRQQWDMAVAEFKTKDLNGDGFISYEEHVQLFEKKGDWREGEVGKGVCVGGLRLANVLENCRVGLSPNQCTLPVVALSCAMLARVGECWRVIAALMCWRVLARYCSSRELASVFALLQLSCVGECWCVIAALVCW